MASEKRDLDKELLDPNLVYFPGELWTAETVREETGPKAQQTNHVIRLSLPLNVDEENGFTSAFYDLDMNVLERVTQRRLENINPTHLTIETLQVPFGLGVQITDRNNESLVVDNMELPNITAYDRQNKLTRFNLIIEPHLPTLETPKYEFEIKRDKETENNRIKRCGSARTLAAHHITGGGRKYKIQDENECNLAVPWLFETKENGERKAHVNFAGAKAHQDYLKTDDEHSKPAFKLGKKDQIVRYLLSTNGLTALREKAENIIKVKGHGLGNGIRLSVYGLAGSQPTRGPCFLTIKLHLTLSPFKSVLEYLQQEGVPLTKRIERLCTPQECADEECAEEVIDLVDTADSASFVEEELSDEEGD